MYFEGQLCIAFGLFRDLRPLNPVNMLFKNYASYANFYKSMEMLWITKSGESMENDNAGE